MTRPDRLFAEYRGALNQELAALGCRITVARQEPEAGSILLLNGDGRELGSFPDTVDAPTIVAIERLLSSALAA